MTAVSVIGAGGHAKVVIATLRDAGHTVGAVYDDDPRLAGASILGIEIAGPASDASGIAIIAVGNNRVRRRLASELGLHWLTLVHPTAYVHDSVALGPGAVVFAGAVIQPGATIGAHAIVNTRASVDHDCRLGDFAHLAPGAHLCGAVQLGDGVLFGSGATARPCARVGDWSVVGSGAAVIADIPDDVTALGVPARVRDAE